MKKLVLIDWGTVMLNSIDVDAEDDDVSLSPFQYDAWKAELTKGFDLAGCWKDFELVILNWDAERLEADDLSCLIALRFPSSLFNATNFASSDDIADVLKSGLSHFEFESEIHLGQSMFQHSFFNCIGYDAVTNVLFTCDYRQESFCQVDLDDEVHE